MKKPPKRTVLLWLYAFFLRVSWEVAENSAVQRLRPWSVLRFKLGGVLLRAPVDYPVLQVLMTVRWPNKIPT